MMTRLGFVSGLVVLVLVTAGCGFVRATGEIVSETRDVGSFDSIELRGSADVTIEIGDEPSVTVQTDEAVIDLVSTEVVDSRLIIDEEHDRFLWVDRIDVTVTTPTVAGISLDGSGVMSARGVADDLTVSVSGSGDVDLTGDVDDLDLVLDGSGSIDAGDVTARSVTIAGDGSGAIDVMVDGSDLTVGVDGAMSITAGGSVDTAVFGIDGSGEVSAQDLYALAATVVLSGSGSVEVTAVQTLDVSIPGSGDVVYHGDPELSRDVTGSGTVQRGQGRALSP